MFGTRCAAISTRARPRASSASTWSRKRSWRFEAARDLSGKELAKALTGLGYQATRQSGSHQRLTTMLNGEHHITVPAHDLLKVGTLSGILADVALHHKMTVKELAFRLFGG